MEDTMLIGGRELKLVFDTAAWVDVEKAFGSLDRMYKRMEEDLLPMTTGLMLTAFCATSGTCDRQKKEAISFDWLVQHASPQEVRTLNRMAREAVLQGMGTTESLFEDDGPVDAMLEEEAAKKPRADA